jgi:hypothetical protein
MANVLDRNFDFLTNGTVTAAGLHNLIDETNIYAGLISTQEEKTTVGTSDLLLVADSSSIGSPQIAANRTTVYNLFEDALTGGTYANAQLSGNLTYGTATGNRTISTGANITNGTISTLIAGTTTSTAAAITNGTITNGTITNGTIATALIPTLTAGTTTGTAGIFTSGTVATLNSTTGTITNLSTTLAGDFTISQGTGTLGTTGATLGTYGGATSVPVLAINAKGQVTSTGTAAITSGLTGFRNRIINGDMRIDQRNAGASVTPVTGAYTLDRWSYYSTQASKFTVQRNAGSVTPPAGYTNYMGITSTSAFSVAASDYFIMTQAIEGFNVSDLSFGTANAKTITLSFWVYSSLTGTFGGVIENSSQDRAYPFSYTISSANTWEQKSVTIAGDTTGTWVTDNGLGLWLMFSLGAGSTFSGTAGAWVGSQRLGVTGAVSVVGTSGATFYITGVQLEAGSTATEFERRPIGTELALCQRYYEVLAPDSEGVTITSFVYQFSPASNRTRWHYKVTKRSLPTVNLVSGSWVSGTPTIYPGVDSAGFALTTSLFSANTALYSLAEL